MYSHMNTRSHTDAHHFPRFPCPAAPIGSISSMEVNVDLLDQMELIDISDQETLDVFFSSGEDGVLTSPLPGRKTRKNRDHKAHQSASFIPNNVSLSDSQSKETTTMRKSSVTGSSDMSWRVLRPSPACPPHLQPLPPTARTPTPTEETPRWSGRTMRKHTPARSSEELHSQRERRWNVRLRHRLRRMYTWRLSWGQRVDFGMRGAERGLTAASVFHKLALSLLWDFPLIYELQVGFCLCFGGGDSEL